MLCVTVETSYLNECAQRKISIKTKDIKYVYLKSDGHTPTTLTFLLV